MTARRGSLARRRTRARAAPVRRRPSARPAADHAIYERIHRAIIEQRLPPGTKLGEEALSGVFSVSRARIRRILLGLAHGQAVELRPNRGAWVAQPTAREAREVFTARRLIEAYIVERVAKSLTAEQRRRLERCVAGEAAAHARGDRAAAIRLSGEYHLVLAELADNAVLGRFLRELVARTSLIIAVYEGPGSSCCAYDEHRALLGEIVAGRGQDAIDLMARHLDRIEARLNLDRAPPRAVDLRDVFPADAARERRR
jgi:DNA-binding GntR family transcriptional regulator